ncbi:MAG: glycosyltransferase family 4 protein [Actinomycetota bacterium]|nr:glycosyltransferase family 4 protein [Actinomycetota bacterium]
MTDKGLLAAINHTSLVSGAEIVLLRALRGARDRGWSVVVACPPGTFRAQLEAAGIDSVSIPELILPAGPGAVAASRLAARTVAAALAIRRVALDADLVLANGLRTLPALRLASPRPPVVLLEHSVAPRAEWRGLMRFCAPVVDLVVGVSRAVTDSVAMWPGFADIPSTIVWNGTLWPVAPAPASPPEPPVIGCSALLTPWKGQEVLLEAVARLGRDEVVLELMGGSFPKDGEYVERLHTRAAQPDLAGRVRFVGHLDDPLERMRRWSVSVSASVDPEAGPLSVLESMSIGIPVVATDHGGPREVLGDAGLFVRPRDADAMAAAIAVVLDDKQLRRRFATAGRKRIANGLALDHQVGALVDELERAASVRRR